MTRNIFMDYLWGYETVNVMGSPAFAYIMDGQVKDLTQVTPEEFLYHAEELANTLPVQECVKFLCEALSIATFVYKKELMNK